MYIMAAAAASWHLSCSAFHRPLAARPGSWEHPRGMYLGEGQFSCHSPLVSAEGRGVVAVLHWALCPGPGPGTLGCCDRMLLVALHLSSFGWGGGGWGGGGGLYLGGSWRSGECDGVTARFITTSLHNNRSFWAFSCGGCLSPPITWPRIIMIVTLAARNVRGRVHARGQPEGFGTFLWENAHRISLAIRDCSTTTAVAAMHWAK